MMPGCEDCSYKEYCGVDVFHHLSTQGDIIGDRFTEKPHGRICYGINIYRGGYHNSGSESEIVFSKDPETYIDISVITTNQKLS